MSFAHHEQYLNSVYYAGLLASAILKMEGVGNLAGWRWIFILEGIATVIIAFCAWLFLPADLSTAKFFTEEERAFARKLPTPSRPFKTLAR